MADSATKEFQISKLELPTLAAVNVKSQSKLKLDFDLRSEADHNPPFLAALVSNVMLRKRGSSGAHTDIIQLQKPGFISNSNNPLHNFTALFSEIQQELVTEARKFSLIQSEYVKECIKRSRSPPTISRTIKTPETANKIIFQFRNNVGFLVRLLFEVLEGPKDIKFKAACEIPSLPDIYSKPESKVAFDIFRKGKQLTDATSYQNNHHVSGFNLFVKR